MPGRSAVVGTLYGNGVGGTSVGGEYQFFGAGPYTATATENLATFGTSYWSDLFQAGATPGETYYIGIRKVSTNQHGWISVTTGSIAHVQTNVNFTSNGAITLGQQIPEPSRAVLLASGLAGLALARRKRKTTSATA